MGFPLQGRCDQISFNVQKIPGLPVDFNPVNRKKSLCHRVITILLAHVTAVLSRETCCSSATSTDTYNLRSGVIERLPPKPRNVHHACFSA
jgi:hypothetical protein